MKLPKLLLLSLTASLAFAQQPRQDENSTQWSPVSLAGEFLEHNYVNWFAYADGVYDTYAPIATNGSVTNSGSFGFDVGGGVSINHESRGGQFSLSYRGAYRDYQSAFYSGGTDQSLGVSYSKQLSRRWSFSSSLGAGVSLYGSTFFATPTPGSTNVVTNNPFSSQSRYLSLGGSVSYQQSRRLSYSAGASYFLQRYNFPGAVGAQGTSVFGAVNYRTSARTTVGLSYSHSYFTFQRGVGTSNGDSIAANVSHQFPNHWSASVSGGVTFSNSSGVLTLPATFYYPNAPANLYITGPYNQSTIFPSFSGTVGRGYRHSNIFVTTGQALSPGNGFYLASKTLYVNGVYSIAIQKRQNVSFSGGFSRLSSVSNAVGFTYASSSITVGYGLNLIRYFGVNARYDYIHYGTTNPNPGINDNRLSFGFNFSSKSIPLTLF